MPIKVGGEVGKARAAPRPPTRALACGAPWTIRSSPSPTPSARASRRTSRTSTGRSSRSSTCPRRSRARCSPATRATRARCGGCSSTSSPSRCRRRPRRGTRREGERAAQLYERIFLGYGDDSVAQLGGTHVACEWVSNVLTKVLQRPRLAAYLEQSTRYIAYDAPMPGGGFRYYRDPSLGPRLRAGDGRALRRPTRAPAARHGVGRRAVPGADGDRARAARDPGQGARPPARPAARRVAVAHGHLRDGPDLRAAHPAPARPPAARGARLRADAARRGPGRHPELRHARRAPRPRRRVDRLPRGPRARRRALGARASGLDREPAPDAARPSVRLLHVDGDEDALLAALLFEAAGVGEEETRIRLAALSARRAGASCCRPRRRARQPPPPPRPRLRGAALPLRDRLRLRRLPRPPAPPDADRPVAAPDARTSAPASPRRSRPPAAATRSAARSTSRATEWERLAGEGREREAPYALCLGYRIRYVLDLNAREAMQLIELRSGREGHPSYRAVAHEMHRLIGQVHPAVAGGDDARRHRGRAAARAHPVRDAHAGEARRSQRALSALNRLHSGPRGD